MNPWPFITASYGATVLVLVGLAVWLVWDRRTVTRRLADLEARGIRRRSATPQGARPK